MNNNHSPSFSDSPEGFDNTQSEGWGDYPLDTVFVRNEQRTINDVVSRIKKGRYQLDPEFQRDFVWDEERQSRLIESCLMRIPLPVFYVAEAKDGRIIIVDGLQRLTTFYRYLNDEFALNKLGSSDPNGLIANKKFSELPIHLQERIEDTQLVLYILDSKAPERARLDIFERVNSGVPLSRQQMRNAIYSGQATKWLKEVSEYHEFTEATGGFFNKNQKKIMRDREVINRFCAFMILGYGAYSDYKTDMDAFLAQALRQMNDMSKDELDDLATKFKKSLLLNKKIFKEHAFRKSLFEQNPPKRTVLNVALFEVFTTVFAMYVRSSIKELPEEQIKEQVLKIYKDDFKQSISSSTNNVSSVNHRFRTIIKVIFPDTGDLTTKGEELVFINSG